MLHQHEFNPDQVPEAVIAVVERCIDQGDYQKLLRVTRELTDPDLVGVQRGRALQEQTTLQCKMRAFAQEADVENGEFDKLCRAEIHLRMRRANTAEPGTKREAASYYHRAAAVQSAERSVARARRQLEIEEQRLAAAQERLREYNAQGRAAR